MKTLYKWLAAVLLFSSTSLSSFGSHISGGDFAYECLGNDSFLITLNLFRDCSGITMGNTQFVNFTSTCGGNTNATLNLINTNGTEISQLCAQQIPNSSCNGGGQQGMQVYTYQAIVVLNPPCDTWTMSWSTCCRNPTSNVPTSNSDNVYLESTMNSLTNNCNNSPQFPNDSISFPLPYVCLDDTINYSWGVIEPDGDSLVYSLIPGMTGAGTNLIYGGGFSGASPIPGITIDSQTGLLTFVPNTLGNFIVVVLIEEYDANGNLLGTTMRDIQFVVMQCTNPPPQQPSGVANFTGNGAQTGPFDIELCEGSTVCFDISFTDSLLAPGDSLFLNSNLTTVLPGATFTETYDDTSVPGIVSVLWNICWTAPAGAAPFNVVTFNASDNGCPVPGINSVTVNVSVINSTVANPDITICGSQTAQLTASGGTTFQWNVISGDPIVVGTNFTCNPCANPIASPSVTTVYEVVSDLSGTCVNRDTTTVFVVPDYTYTITQSSPTSCLLEDININVDVTPAGPGYTYQWYPSNGLDYDTVPNPIASIITPGTHTFYVDITSPDGCVKTDSISINVAPSYAPNVTALITGEDTIWCGDTTYLDVDLGNTIPVTCGLSATGCAGSPSQLTVGTSTNVNTNTGYPAPYGNWYWGARHQILFRASELQAMGFNGGQITELAFDIQSIQGANTYNGWEIRMGCTNSTELTNWETGLVTVYPATNINLSTGWNTYTFTNAFDWDGLSNIVVEICFNNSSYIDNSISYFTNTTYNSVLYYRADISTVCYNGTPTTSMERPNTRFTTCNGTAPPGAYSFSWSPSNSLDDPTLQAPMATPTQTTTYTVVVTDNQGGCTDTSSVTVEVNCGVCWPPNPIVQQPSCNGDNDGYIIAPTTNLINGPWNYTWVDSTTNAVLQTTLGVTTSDTLSGLAAGTYIIQVQDTSGCVADTIVTIGEPPVVTVQAVNDTTLCIGGTVDLSAVADGGNGPTYLLNWDNGLIGNGPHTASPTADTMYIVYAEDPLGCLSENDTVFVSILPPLQVTTSGNDSICSGNSITISATATGGSGNGYTYAWTENGNPIGTGQSITVTPSSTNTNYCVTVTDDCETPSASDCLIMDFYLNPDVNFTADNVAGCYPVPVNFTNTTSSNLIGSSIWLFGDGNGSEDTLTTSYTYQIPGCYDVTLTVTSPDGCVSDTTIPQMICAYDYPDADFIMGPQPTNLYNTEINFSDQSFGTPLTYEWFFGDSIYSGLLGASDEQNPSFVFPDQDPGSYEVTLVVTNQYGCTDTTYQTVIIDGVYNIYVPNAFTPNGDGINDFFAPVGEGIDADNYELLIFDRWGELVYRSTDQGLSWGGTIKGVELAKPEVYVWKLVAKDRWTEDKHQYIGHVTLVR